VDLKLVILDNPNQLLNGSSDSETCKKIFSDIIQLRQKCYTGVKSQLITIDLHDLCATHVLIYDMQKIFCPRLVAGLRICFESRAKFHGANLPFVEHFQRIDPPLYQKEFKNFRKLNSELVNPNQWYVEPTLGFNKSGVPLSGALVWTMAVWIRRMGFNSLVGMINKEFKTERWFKDFGEWDPKLTFFHPHFQRDHQLVLMHSLYDSMIDQGFLKYGSLYNERQEIAKEEINDLQPLKKAA